MEGKGDPLLQPRWKLVAVNPSLLSKVIALKLVIILKFEFWFLPPVGGGKQIKRKEEESITAPTPLMNYDSHYLFKGYVSWKRRYAEGSGCWSPFKPVENSWQSSLLKSCDAPNWGNLHIVNTFPHFRWSPIAQLKSLSLIPYECWFMKRAYIFSMFISIASTSFSWCFRLIFLFLYIFFVLSSNHKLKQNFFQNYFHLFFVISCHSLNRRLQHVS